MVPAGERDKHEDLSPGVGTAHPLGTCSVHSDTREITALEEDPYLLSLLRSNSSWGWVSLVLQPVEGQGPGEGQGLGKGEGQGLGKGRGSLGGSLRLRGGWGRQ